MPKSTDINTDLSTGSVWAAADDQALADLRARSIDDSLTEAQRAEALGKFNVMDARRADLKARDPDADKPLPAHQQKEPFVSEQETRRADGATSVGEAREADGSRLDQRTDAQRADEIARRGLQDGRNEAELARERVAKRYADLSQGGASGILPETEFDRALKEAKRGSSGDPTRHAALTNLEVAYGEFHRAVVAAYPHVNDVLAPRLGGMFKEV